MTAQQDNGRKLHFGANLGHSSIIFPSFPQSKLHFSALAFPVQAPKGRKMHLYQVVLAEGLKHACLNAASRAPAEWPWNAAKK